MYRTVYLMNNRANVSLNKNIQNIINNYSRLLLVNHKTIILNKRYKNSRPTEIIQIANKAKNMTNLHDFSNINAHTARTHTCGQLRADDAGKSVILCGWLEHTRLNHYIILKDGHGVTKFIIPEKDSELNDLIIKTPLESILLCYGRVKLRPVDETNKEQPTGMIEVILDKFIVQNSVDSTLPFQIRKFDKYPEMQCHLRLRPQLLMKLREYLIDFQEFVEVESPTSFKRSPCGVIEMILPICEIGKCDSSARNTVQLKHLAMLGSVDKYFQVVKCPRERGAKLDRQPEFAQVNIEMSLTDQNKVMSLVEELLSFIWPSGFGKIKTPFPCLSYTDAMLTYGSDKPDIGCNTKISNWTKFIPNTSNEVFALVLKNIENSLSNKQLNDLKSLISTNYPDVKFSLLKIKSLKTFKENLQEMFQGINVDDVVTADNISENDLVAISSSSSKLKALSVLGKINENCKVVNPNDDDIWRFVWIVHFPFYQAESSSINLFHHPSTQPQTELTSQNVFEFKGYHYYLVLNGSEVGSGFNCVHDAVLQTKVLESILKIPAENMSDVIESFYSECSSRGGIGLGIDTILSILSCPNNIRNLIGFPKTKKMS